MSVHPVLAALLLIGVASTSAAQTLTVNGAASATVRSGEDYATTRLGDAWDFNARSDYFYSASQADDDLPTWNGMPTLSGGLLRGVAARIAPRLPILFPGFTSSLNVVGTNGSRYPIDSGRYVRLSIRYRRSAVDSSPSAQFDVNQVIWFNDPLGPGGRTGGLQALTRGFDPFQSKYSNQSPVASQTTTSFHIYKMDLDTAAFLTQWNAAGVVRGLRLDLGTSTAPGTTVDVDWVRLTPRGVATTPLAWSGFTGAVTLTATNAASGDVVQIFPDDGSRATTFASAGTFTWDYGFLPPGTWVVTATGAGGGAASATLRVAAPPIIHVTEPDDKGGRDFSRAVTGDAWDMTNPQDVTRWGSSYNIVNPSFGESGLTATSGATSSTGIADPVVCLLDGATHPDAPVINADVYRHLSFTLEYDRPELVLPQALSDEWGGVMRVHWNPLGSNKAGYTGTQQVIVPDGPRTYAMDLGSFVTIGNRSDGLSHLVDPAPRLWTGPIRLLRIDPYESQRARTFRISDVRLAADDAPNGNGFFIVKWTASDASFDEATPAGPSDATVTLYYDADQNPANGRTLIAQNLPAAQGQLAWHLAGVPVGRYWILAEITDTVGHTQSRYSTGPLLVNPRVQPLVDANGDLIDDTWAARHGITSASNDDDGDGLTNLEEFRAATHPLVPQTWNLSEGATGFFAERIALVNPDPYDADVTVTFLRESGAPVVRSYTLAPQSRVTIPVNDVTGLAQAAVSSVVTSSVGTVIPERTMVWDATRPNNLYGAHTGKGIPAARTSWFLAEGEQSFFQTYILFANANPTPGTVTVRFLLEGGSPVVKTYGIEAHARLTVYAGLIPELVGKAFSTAVTSSVPITVERAMYFGSTPQRLWNGGHEAAAVPSAATNWFVAEGRTGPVFDMYLLLANPNAVPTVATIRYLLQNGRVETRSYPLDPQSRRTVHVDSQAAALADAEVSAEITAPQPIVVERAMYWPDPSPNWYEAHASAGVTQTGTLWVLAEGEIGGPLNWSTYVLLANPSPNAATATLTYLRNNRPPIVLTRSVPANSRVTIPSDGLGLESGERFGVVVDTGAGGVPIVVEHALYFDGLGQPLGAGMNESGVRVR